MSPFTVRKSWTPFPGIRLNLNKRSLSVTLGGKKGPHYTASTTGRRTTSMNLPGPLGYRKTTTAAGRRRVAEEDQLYEAERADLQARKDVALERRQIRKAARLARREARRNAQ